MAAIAWPEGPVVARVNGVEIKTADWRAEVTRQLRLATEQYQIDWNDRANIDRLPAFLDRELEHMVDLELLRQAAAREGITITEADVEKEAAVIGAHVVAGGQYKDLDAYLQANQLTPEGFRAQVYERILRERLLAVHGGTAEVEQVHARHILVDDEATAQEVLRKLAVGESFEALARAYSKDSGSRERGGDLGWVPPGVLEAGLDEAVFALGVGETSRPVRTRFGYHIVRVEERARRALAEPMASQRREEQFAEWLAAQRSASKIEKLYSSQLEGQETRFLPINLVTWPSPIRLPFQQQACYNPPPCGGGRSTDPERWEGSMSDPHYTDLDLLGINTIRMLAADAVQAAESGHPGMPMGMATAAYVLWTRFLRHNPANPAWANRDRFLLSAGHGSMLLYSLLHLSGYDLPLSELRRFRQWGSATPGHPERGLTPGVETTTGPLGQGFGNGVGVALAERYLAQQFNRPGYQVVDHYTYAIVSDGDLMEGVSAEAASLAGHWRLGKLIYLYDDNRITIEGPAGLSFTEDAPARFRAYGWQVQTVDGLDPVAVEEAIRSAQAERERPSLIDCRTHIAYGSPHKQDTAAAHGEPLGAEEVRLTKERLGWPLEPAFYVPEVVRGYFEELLEYWRHLEADWHALFERYRQAHPDLAAEFDRTMAGELPVGWQERLPHFSPGKPLATRSASGQVLNALAPAILGLVGGSADLAPSTKTYMEGLGDQQAATPGGRNLHFGVREHAMGAIVNGLAAHGGLRPFGATFLTFSDYQRPALRLSAIMGLPAVWVYTHDSILLGEDGPTHQPIEHLASLRAIPRLVTIRPADANETAVAWQVALEREGPVALILTRQDLPVFDRAQMAPAAGLRRGAYTLLEAPDGRPDLILIGTGSEVALAVEARERLAGRGIGARVVSMPSWELFEIQPEAYRQEVLPDEVPVRLAVEAGSPQGWERYVGPFGAVLGIRGRFGASAPRQVLAAQYGLTADDVVARAEELLEGFAERAGLMERQIVCVREREARAPRPASGAR